VTLGALGQQTRRLQIRSTGAELFCSKPIYDSITGLSVTLFDGFGALKDKTKMNDLSTPRPPRNGLGPNSDIGAKLRAYYGAVQDQPIPDRFLDLLEKLDQVEQASGKRKDG
jgi:hypothetical protein